LVTVAADASRLAALLVGQMHPAFSLLAPCDPGASAPTMTNLFPTEPLQRARTLLAQRTPCTVLTGAGVSAESGVPTFRGAGGLWRSFRAEDLATPDAFGRDPKLVWEWYDWRRQQVAAVRPNPAHHALASFGGRAAGFTLVTQNVDGLHDAAGSANTVKLHGDIWEVRCTRCVFAARDTRVPLAELPPRCRCGAA